MTPDELRKDAEVCRDFMARQAMYAAADAWEADRMIANGAARMAIEIENALGRLEAAEKERKEAKRHTYCAYCGKQYPLDDPGTPMAVTRHIFGCPKHPIAEIRRRLVNRVWGNCTLGTAEELEAQALIDYIDESAALAGEEKT